MQVYEFMVPTHDNAGREFAPVHVETFDAWLGKKYGGFTKLAPATGFWTDNAGQVYRESVIPYRVATDDEHAPKAIADVIARGFSQLAVYVGKIGTCDIVDYQ
jgi:hypothetical protein